MVSKGPDAADLDDLDSRLPDGMRIAVANMMFAWGAYDSAITYWLAKTLGTPLDVASIMFGNMQTDTKLTKLRTLFEHYGMSDAATGLKQLRAQHQERVVARNAVAHSRCVGVLKSQPDHYAFSTVAHVKGSPGMLGLSLVPYAEVILSAKFASDSAKQIMELADKSPWVVPAPHARE